ncbi:MAG: lipid II:glycine glycyltransferase FemX [Lentimicrobium sp.]
MFKIFEHTRNYEPVFIAVLNKDEELLSLLLGVIQVEFSAPLGYLTSRAVIDGGPLVLNDDEQILKLTLKEFARITKKKAIYALFRNYRDWSSKKQIFNECGFTYTDHLNILVHLSRPVDEIWLAVHKYRRREIKKAGLKGLIVKMIELDDYENLDRAYEILLKLYSKLNIPIPDKSIFDYSVEVLKEKESIRLFGAFLGDVLVGVRYVLCYNTTIFDWYAGSLNEYLAYHPNDVLPWEVFKWGAENGYSVFDFGGAGNPKKAYGVRDYKLKFGGEMFSPGRFSRIYNPVVYYPMKALFNIRKAII